MNSRHKKNKKIFIVPLLAALLVAGGIAGYLAYAKHSDKWPFMASTTSNNSASGDSPNNAATDSANSSDNTYNSDKNNDSSDTPSKTDDSSGKKIVNVSIAFADIVDDSFEVRAYIDDIIEGTGTCTATITTSNGTKVTGSSAAFINATSTQCRPIEIDKSKVPSGKWSVYVEYSSSTSTGKSPALEGTI